MAFRWRTASLVLTAAIVVLRVIVACGSDDSDAMAQSDASDEANDNPKVEPSESGDAPDAARPAFCSGIVFYASFDKTFAPELGGGTTLSAGAVLSDPQGQFAQALSLVANVADPDGGAAHYFVAGDSGTSTPFPVTRGTLSMWFRASLGSTDPTHPSQVFYRPVASLPPAALDSTGLLLARLGDQFGLYVIQPVQRPILTFPVRDVAPYLRGAGYNHVVTAWRESPEGGTGPTAYMAVNGGLGELMNDASVDADYKGVTPDDAGDLRVPYRAFSSQAWQNGNPVVALRLGAPTVSSSLEGSVDDVVVWDRLLGFGEMADVYAARAAVGDLCGLR